MLHLLCVSRASSWSLRGRWRFLTGVLVFFNMMDVSRIHQGSYISIFKSLPAWEVLHLLGISGASSWSPRGRWRLFLQSVIQVSSMESKRTLRGVLVVFEILDVSRISRKLHINFKSLPALEVLHLLCISRASSWSLRRRWRFLTGVLVVFDMKDAPRIHQGSYISISKSLPS